MDDIGQAEETTKLIHFAKCNGKMVNTHYLLLYIIVLMCVCVRERERFMLKGGLLQKCLED